MQNQLIISLSDTSEGLNIPASSVFNTEEMLLMNGLLSYHQSVTGEYSSGIMRKTPGLLSYLLVN